MQYERFKVILDEILFTDAKKKLLINLREYPSRFIGLFRASNPRGKLIQNYTQSLEIRFGDALELIFREMFEEYNLEPLPLNYTSDENKTLSIDQVFKYEEEQCILFIEQKVRDDHDSTKKAGQFNNFVDKYHTLKREYKDYKIVGAMWFIDESLTKNNRYYNDLLDAMEHGNDELFLAYGGGLFEKLSEELKIKSSYIMWKDINDYLECWKEDIPDLPDVNYDKNTEETMEVFKEIIDEKGTNYLNKLFENEKIIKEIFPIIFPYKTSLEQLKTNLEMHLDSEELNNRDEKNINRLIVNLQNIIK